MILPQNCFGPQLASHGSFFCFGCVVGNVLLFSVHGAPDGTHTAFTNGFDDVEWTKAAHASLLTRHSSVVKVLQWVQTVRGRGFL